MFSSVLLIWFSFPFYFFSSQFRCIVLTLPRAYFSLSISLSHIRSSKTCVHSGVEENPPLFIVTRRGHKYKRTQYTNAARCACGPQPSAVTHTPLVCTNKFAQNIMSEQMIARTNGLAATSPGEASTDTHGHRSVGLLDGT